MKLQKNLSETFAKPPFLPNFYACPVKCLPNEMFIPWNACPMKCNAYFAEVATSPEAGKPRQSLNSGLK